jgi:type VI secretion system Hcp family effector
MAVVLKLIDHSGVPIKGESEVPNHVDEIDVQTWSWGVTSPAGVKFNMLNMSIRKAFDLASPKILSATATRETLQGVLTVIDQQGNDSLTATLKTTTVESVNIGEQQYPPAEEISLRFDSIELSYKAENVILTRPAP